jgi:hypothetical protein
LHLAKFKTRLFIFFAGRLLKWAESIEREIGEGHAPPATAVDDSNADLFAEPSRESERASGPPEHWARLLGSGPPQHWLDLVGQKAPQLLTPLDDDPFSTPAAEEESSAGEYFGTDSNQDANSEAAGEKGAFEAPPESLTLRPVGSRDETTQPAREAVRRTWLNRLRFEPPARRAEQIEPSYVASESGKVDSPGPRPAGGAGEERAESTPEQRTSGNRTVRDQSAALCPEQTIAARQSVAEFSASPRDEERLSDRHSRPRLDDDDAALQRSHRRPAIQNSLRDNAVKGSTPEEIVPVNVRDVHRIRLKSPAEHEANPPTNTRARTRNNSIAGRYMESSAGERAGPSTELNQVGPVKLEKQAGTNSSAQIVRQVRTDEFAGELERVSSAVHTKRAGFRKVEQGREVRATDNGPEAPISVTTTNQQVRNQPLFSRRPAKNVDNGDEQARIEFASVELAAPGPIESRTESNKNVWPTLPPAPKFDIADELAAMEHEAETLQRLEQEQRGILWNA